MKRLILIISLILITKLSICQNQNYKDYALNNFQLFSFINDDYLSFLKERKIKRLTEWIYKYDTLGKLNDSSIANYYLFDTIGHIIEKRYDYRFNSKKYKSIKYNYTNGLFIDSIIYDPYERPVVVDGYYVSYKLKMYCEYRNDSYQIETIKIQKFVNDKIYTMNYYYCDLYVQHYVKYKEYLIDGLDYYEGDRLVQKHIIQYEK